MAPTPHHRRLDAWSAATYGDAFADVYDEWYDGVTDVRSTVATLVALGGPVLELGIGTGRLAVAMSEAGLEVHGIDASAAMIDRLRAKPGGSTIEVTIGDMSQALPAGPFASVLVAYNTLFNLAEVGQQARAVALAAGVLAEGGHLVIEAAVPGDAPASAAGQEGAVRVRSIEPDRVVLAVSAPEHDGSIVGQFVELKASGVVMRPWRVRMSTPAELDRMADSAGLTLVSRHGGWNGESFDEGSSSHVSIWRKAHG